MTDNSNKTTSKRPAFLKVLCILSFIMCGLMIFAEGAMLIISVVADSNSFDEADRNNPVAQFMNFAANSGSDSLMHLIVQLVSLTGVLFMWRLRKSGFYIYLVAECFLYFEFLYAILSSHLNATNAFGVAVEMIWPLPLDLAFIIMYATQLKYMSWKAK